ncbi:SDR family NAD(P)-dependent oxidoreductase [Mesorhizobium sp. M1329]|uniref:SDR family NAD(P)-dependent oxidoreductase n=1 Tax=Mesorhizobium sp. M1329 TaxID=2957083 RepID=UPI0033370C8B
MFSLQGKKAVVTGGSQGLGREIARIFARQGADVLVAYRRLADEHGAEADETLRLITEAGGRATMVDMDVTDPAAVEALAKQARELFGHVDILVNNVGGYPTKPVPLIEMSDQDWDLSISLNMRSTFLCCRVFGRMMSDQGFGRIVNITSSRAGCAGLETNAHYGAAKGGVAIMSKALARELGPKGITVNVVSPGRMDTPLGRVGAKKGWWESSRPDIVLGRLGMGEDVAPAVLFFASDEAGWITGQTLHVNGGSLMP